MSNDNGGKFFTGLFIGATLGAIAALFLAPKTGKELRRSLRKEGAKLAEDADGVISELRARGGDAYEKAAEGVRDAARSLGRS